MARRGRGAGVRMLAAMALATALVACGEGGPGQLAAPAVAEGDPDFADVLRQRLIDARPGDVIEVPADAMGAEVVEAYLGIKRAGSL